MKFEINDTSYTMPKSLKEVALADFIKVQKALQSAESELDKMVEVVAGLTKVDKEILYDAETKLVKTLFDELDFFTTASHQSVESFQHRGETYYVNSLDNSTFREFATFEKVLDQFKGGVEGIPFLMAVLCRKKGERFKDVDVEQRAALFQQVDAETALGLSGFFFSKETAYRESLEASSRLDEVREGLRESLKQISMQSTAGHLRLSLWQRMLLKWMRYTILQP